jgi:ribosomal protein S8E
MEIDTVLLITLIQSGELIAQIQSGIVPLPRIIRVSSPQALEEAWNNQKNGQIFYNSVYSIGLDKELTEKMKELGIKEGPQQKAKKYRLGNQPQEYELKEDYLNWLPMGIEDWQEWCFNKIRNTELVIFNPQDKTEKIIFLHHFISKDAFPLEFFGEERAEKWNSFAIVSETQTSEKFIIPLVAVYSK